MSCRASKRLIVVAIAPPGLPRRM